MPEPDVLCAPPATAAGPAPQWLRPTSIAEAVQMRADHAGSQYAAGMTALQLGWPEAPHGSRPETTVIDISRLDMGPVVMQQPGGWLRIAANAPLEQVRRDPLTARFDALRGLIDAIAATGVRGLATLGGNLCWGTGDAAVFCAAFETRLMTAQGPVTREALPPDALLLAVDIRPAPGFIEKVGFRAAFSPARVLLAGCEWDVHLQLAARLQGLPVAVATVTSAPSRSEIAAVADALCAGAAPDSEDAAILRALCAGRLGARVA